MSQALRPEPMFPVDADGAPTIELTGRAWAVPTLALKQSRHVVPALMEILPLVTCIPLTAHSAASLPLM